MNKRERKNINITGFEISLLPEIKVIKLSVYFTGGSGELEVWVEGYEDLMQTVNAKEKVAKFELVDFEFPELVSENDTLDYLYVVVSQTGELADNENINIDLDEVAKNGNYLSVCW